MPFFRIAQEPYHGSTVTILQKDTGITVDGQQFRCAGIAVGKGHIFFF